MNNIDLKNKFSIYILFSIFFSVFYLYIKHDISNDSSISEWLINYHGGFTRRGLGGEINIFLSNIFNISLRQSIFFLQSIIHVSYLIIILKYFKDLKFNIIQIFALFTPIFILYPIAEIEVLGRKEMLLFLFFIGSIVLSEKRYSATILNNYVFFLFPLVCLVWEEAVLFAPYLAVLIVFKNNLNTFKKLLYKLLIIFGPSIITFLIIFLFPLSREGHVSMCGYLTNVFGERCYMSASLLVTSTIYFDTFDVVHGKASIEHYFRFLMIFFIGFLPLNLLITKNSFKQNSNFINKNFKLHTVFFILYSPSILLFIFGYDWGRWINITYTFSILLYFFLLKNELITNKLPINSNFTKKILSNKKYLIPLFFIFAFGWNPKTVITGDISTNSLYKIVYNSSKKIFNHDGIRILQGNPIIKFHKLYIE